MFFLNRLFVKALCGLSLLMSSGCSFIPNVPDTVKAQHPSNLPKPVITNFNEALACMDDLMVASHVAPIYVASSGLVNYTSEKALSDGGKEMLITALSKMAIRSKGVRFISYGSDIKDVLDLQGAHPNHNNFRTPDFFIRGGVTQHNKSLWSGQRGVGASLQLEAPSLMHGGTFFLIQGQEDISASYSLMTNYGTVTLDMSAGFISTLEIIPGVTSANTLALTNQDGTSVSADISLHDLGFSYSFSDYETFDFNTVYRSLIQVGSIEIVGKLHNLPYWRCLANAGKVEEREGELLKKFMQLQGGEALIKGVQQVLHDLHYYSGKIHGELDLATQESLQKYQQHMGLIASGQVNFETFRMMNLFTPTQQTPTSYWWQKLPSTFVQSSPAAAAVSTVPSPPEAASNTASVPAAAVPKK